MYKYFKCPIAMVGSVFVEWKKDNSPIYNCERCCGEVFICIGALRVIITPRGYKPVTKIKKGDYETNVSSNNIRKCNKCGEWSHTQHSLEVVEGNRKV